MEKSPIPVTDDCMGFIRYEGKLVEEGILDAKSAAKALHGFDHALRYFVSQNQPDLATVDFPIPVRIQRGSWWATIPQSAETWVIAAMGIAGTTYLTKDAAKMAERDFSEVGFKDVFQKALKSIQWMIRIGKHVGNLTHKKLTGLRWTNNNETVGIPNACGGYLEAPRVEFERFLECPSSILSEMASVVEDERSLTVGVNENGRIEEATVTRNDRSIFFADENDVNESLFPELAHGQRVELDGIVTRGNERTNSIGFLYKEHVITCYPKLGSIVRFKPHLFLNCKIVGEITRQDSESGEFDEARPKILFDELLLLEDEGDQGRLF